MSIARVGHSKQEMLGGNCLVLCYVVSASFIPRQLHVFYFRVEITCFLLTGVVFGAFTFRGNGTSFLQLC